MIKAFQEANHYARTAYEYSDEYIEELIGI